MRKGDIGAPVTQLQRQLVAAGIKLTPDGVFGDATEAALKAFQQRAGLVADGIAGPKTIAALISRDRNPKFLGEKDLARAAERLGVPVAAIKAVNEVESRGRGYLDDGRPVILYERHIAYRRIAERGGNADALVERYPTLINPQRGGYAGGAAEWSRLASARQITPAFPGIAEEACSWGQFQIMGYHWESLGYASIDEFVATMNASESQQLDAFARFIEADAALLKALKARKWDAFAKAYNGPAYRENLYDVKLARAFERHASEPEVAA